MVRDLQEEVESFEAMIGESEACLVEEGDAVTKETCTASAVTEPTNCPVNRRIMTTVVLWRFVVWTSVACAVINCLVSTISVLTGEWLFGQVCCQMFGWLSQVLVSVSAWMVALFTLERSCFYLMPTEYTALMSEINTKILAYGIGLILLVLHTGPLYGWAEYSWYTGGLPIQIVPEKDLTNLFLRTGSGYINSTDVLGHSTETVVVNTQDAKIVYFQALQALQNVVQNLYGCTVRTKLYPVFELFIRCHGGEKFQTLMDAYASGELRDSMQMELSALQNKVSEGIANNVYIDVSDEDMVTYRNLHLSVQDLDMCTLDWSTVNEATTTWIPIVMLTTTLIPYTSAIIASLVLLRSSKVRTSRDFVFPTCFSCLIGAVFGLVSASFYYGTRLLMHNFVTVDRIFYTMGSVFYYISSLLFTVTVLLSRRLCTKK